MSGAYAMADAMHASVLGACVFVAALDVVHERAGAYASAHVGVQRPPSVNAAVCAAVRAGASVRVHVSADARMDVSCECRTCLAVVAAVVIVGVVAAARATALRPHTHAAAASCPDPLSIRRRAATVAGTIARSGCGARSVCSGSA